MAHLLREALEKYLDGHGGHEALGPENERLVGWAQPRRASYSVPSGRGDVRRSCTQGGYAGPGLLDRAPGVPEGGLGRWGDPERRPKRPVVMGWVGVCPARDIAM